MYFTSLFNRIRLSLDISKLQRKPHPALVSYFAFHLFFLSTFIISINVPVAISAAVNSTFTDTRTQSHARSSQTRPRQHTLAEEPKTQSEEDRNEDDANTRQIVHDRHGTRLDAIEQRVAHMAGINIYRETNKLAPGRALGKRKPS